VTVLQVLQVTLHVKSDLEYAKRDLEHAKRGLEHAKRDLEYAKSDLKYAKRDLEHAKRSLHRIPEVRVKERVEAGIAGVLHELAFIAPLQRSLVSSI
jgi:5-bromo-4-chloroindolyl phosphate hydrolysis protein